MDILKQIEAKNKGFKIIQSCTTKEHCESTTRYINRYFEKFEDFLGYTELNNALLEYKNSVYLDSNM